MSGDDLVAFLLARIAEDEQAARLMAKHYPSPWDTSDRGYMARVVADAPHFREVCRLEGSPGEDDGIWLGEIIEHVARHDPPRVLADCEAKRRIVELHGVERLADPPRDEDDVLCTECGTLARDERPVPWPCDTLRLLALPFADHPDYQEAWRPE